MDADAAKANLHTHLTHERHAVIDTLDRRARIEAAARGAGD